MADSAAARAEFQRKQRDRKRLYRKRLKDDMTAMRAQVTDLEAAYAALYSQRVQQQQQTAQADAELQLRRRYEAARTEMTALRRQIAHTKKQLSDFDLFTASLESYLSEFPSPAGSVASPGPSQSSRSPGSSAPTTPTPTLKIDTTPSQSPQYITDAACQQVIRECYQAYAANNWSGRSVSTGGEMLGWTDRRFVDGGTLQFALSKAFPALGKEYLMQRTWDILTTARHMRTLQAATTEVTILQHIGDDAVLLERRATHPQLNRISCVHLLVFRLRTESGYIVAFKAVNPPGSPQESAAETTPASSPSPLPWSDDEVVFDDDSDRANVEPKPEPKPKPKLTWVETMQWFVFDELELSLDDPFGFAPDGSFDFAGNGPGGTRVLIGGRTANCDESFANYFIFEIVTYIIRWESAVAGARLLLS
ncbi:hypothetical protein PybrP1_009916 [[Pythium] brassicae (nom. inval.)]|nr:hypothetical protein PybrP1_009916 [[Pythium] brassicae (nom. inval.)]